jgi:ATP-dependent helicase/nuclease subunit A
VSENVTSAASDAPARDRARGVLPAHRRGRLLVEAAAGAGKTTVLLERVLAYVEAGERTLAEMAIITFTEQAAAELRVRLRQEIAVRLRRAGGPGEAPGREPLRQALLDLETAAVGTIHAFCLDLLRQRPVEAGVDPAFAVADAFAQRLLFAEAWEELLRAMPAEEPGLEAAQDLDVAAEPRLRALARDLMTRSPEDLPRPLAASELDFARRWRAALDTAGRAAALARPGSALAHDLERVLAKLGELDVLPERARERALLEEEKAVTPSGRAGRQDEIAAKAERDRLRRWLVELRADLHHQRLNELAAWLVRAGERYRSLTEKGSLLDFDELVRRAAELLRRHPAVRADFRRRYPLVLVDEFQDTDRAQIELVLLLAGPEEAAAGASGDPGRPAEPPRALFLVGDPKQSIYRFRGADLEAYAEVRARELRPGARVSLTRTFRLLPAIGAWVNEVMARVMAPAAAAGPGAAGAAGDGREPWEAAYEPLDPVVPAAEPAFGGVLYLDLAEPDPPRVRAARELEAEALARLARRLVAGPEGAAEVRGEDGRLRPARYGDLALLVPRMTLLELYEDAFNRQAVPFRVVGGRHYYRRDEVHALLEILRALADPGDPVATVGALRGPGFGVSDRALAAYALCRPRPRLDGLDELGALAAPDGAAEAARRGSPDPDAAADAAAGLAALAVLRRSTAGLPLTDLVATVLERTGLLPFYALTRRGEQRVANLQKAVEVARRVEAAGHSSLPAFVRWLEQLLEEEPEEADSPYLEGAEEAVRVTTIHRAKGLEFPIVLLGGLAGDEAPSGGLRVLPAAPAAAAPSDSRRGTGRVEIQLRKGVGTRGHLEAAEHERRREQAEDKRLLYVALTRARDLLVLPRLPERTRIDLTPLYRALWQRGGAHQAAAAHRRIAALELADAPGPTPRAPRAPRLEDLRPGDLGGDVEERAAAWAPPAAAVAVRRPAGLAAAARLLVLAALRDAAPAESPTPPVPAEERVRAEELARCFLESPLGRRARAAATRVVEESVAGRLACGAIYDGRVDLAFREPAGWVVVDFEPDAAGQETALRAAALERATGVPVAAAVRVDLVTLGMAPGEPDAGPPV